MKSRHALRVIAKHTASIGLIAALLLMGKPCTVYGIVVSSPERNNAVQPGIFRSDWLKNLGPGDYTAQVTDLALEGFNWLDGVLDVEV